MICGGFGPNNDRSADETETITWKYLRAVTLRYRKGVIHYCVRAEYIHDVYASKDGCRGSNARARKHRFCQFTDQR
jgi:hypothetical protein